ncbi:unnamed protein product [Linum tenue]|uniref:Uncharacterized protein n=1 Tax=Linum tenue TaxID=586396 RepID=A0AAV0KUQ7_9ROSI|nr:unnamed protein product [Linum tenue]
MPKNSTIAISIPYPPPSKQNHSHDNLNYGYCFSDGHSDVNLFSFHLNLKCPEDLSWSTVVRYKVMQQKEDEGRADCKK